MRQLDRTPTRENQGVLRRYLRKEWSGSSRANRRHSVGPNIFLQCVGTLLSRDAAERSAETFKKKNIAEDVDL